MKLCMCKNARAADSIGIWAFALLMRLKIWSELLQGNMFFAFFERDFRVWAFLCKGVAGRAMRGRGRMTSCVKNEIESGEAQVMCRVIACSIMNYPFIRE